MPDVLPGASGAGPVVTGRNATWKDYNRPAIVDAGALRSTAPRIIEAGQPSLSEDRALGILAAAVSVSATKRLRVVQTPVGPVAVRYDELRHVVKKRAHARERYGRYLVPTLEDPFEVWLTEYEDGYRIRYIGLFDDKRNTLVVARQNQDGSLFWNFVRKDLGGLNAQRRGALLYGKKKRGFPQAGTSPIQSPNL